MDSNYCVICLVSDASGIEVFGEEGKQMKIAEIVSKHFWFQLTQSDDICHFVCFECWVKTHSFHYFYETVENRHSEYFSNGVLPIENISDQSQEKSDKASFSVTNDYAKNDIKLKTECELILDDIATIEDNGHTATTIVSEPAERENHKKAKITSDTSDSDDGIEDGGDGDYNENENGNENDVDDESVSDSGEEQSTKSVELVIPSYFDMTCDRCDAILQTLAEARNHYIDRHSYFNGYLKCCNKRFKTRGHIQDHIQWHDDPNSFVCTECNKSFNAKRRLASHMLRHAPEESKQFGCDQCEKRFSKKFLLNKHIRLVHSVQNENIICHLCNKKFKLQLTLKNHIASVHERSYCQICEICAKTFKTKQGFREHLETHKDTEETRVQCSYCNAMLKNRVSLKTHIRRSHKSTPKKCPFCDKIKPNQQSLTSHIMVVHTRPTHFCTICDKSFTKALSLTEHISTHTGENLYTCSYCPKTFKSNSNMYKHKKCAHPEQWSGDRKKKVSC